jgi:hypothetical protein
MTTINHETYCGQDLITLLRKAGFNWQDYFVAHSIDEHFHWEIPLHIAQRWLREVKNIQIIASPLSGSKKWTPLICKDFWLLHEDLDGIALTPENFDTYEEALESGIKKALGIILEKGE